MRDFIYKTSLFGATLALAACAPESHRPSSTPANSSTAIPAATRLKTAEANVQKFCDLEHARCDEGDAMAWQLRLRMNQIAEYAPAAAANGKPVRFLEDWQTRYQRALEQTEKRLAAQDGVIEALNRDYGCHVRRYGEGEQMTFGRELSGTGCQPLRATDPAGAAQGLRRLASLSLPSEGNAIRGEATLFDELGPLVSDLASLKQEILGRGILYFDPPGTRRLKAAHIGHPFERSNEVRWLKAYAYNVRRLSKRWGDLTQSYRVVCLEPACDPEIFKVAEAADFYPPLDWGFLRDGDRVVAPAPYALSYFGQRYSANVEIREALGLNLQRSWLWNSELYASHLRPNENTLSFAQLFPKEGVSLTIANYQARTEYTNVLPLFLTFQEARGVMDVILDMRKQELQRLTEHEKAMVAQFETAWAEERAQAQTPQASEKLDRVRLEKRHQISTDLRAESKLLQLIGRVHEMRFEPCSGAGYVALENNQVGLRLVLRVLEPKEDRPIDQVRAEIYREIPEVFHQATQNL